MSSHTDPAVMAGCISWRYMAEPLRSTVIRNMPALGGVCDYRCAAHEYRMLAAGHCDYLVFNRLMPWDHLPGWLLHQEAGGYSAHFDGSPLRPTDTAGGLICAPSRAGFEALVARCWPEPRTRPQSRLTPHRVFRRGACEDAMAAAKETDEEIMVRVGTGDRAAFARLLARHSDRVLALAGRLVGHDAAEDVLQETFTRAWVKAPGWRAAKEGGTAQPGTWLARVAINLSLDRLRRRPDLPLEAAPEPADPAVGAEQAVLTRERDAAVAGAVAALPERQRAAVALVYDAGLSNAEAASAMSISIGAFELLLVRARKSLRQQMQEWMGEGP